MLAAQDAAQGLDPLVHVQETIDSGLNKADAAIYAEAGLGNLRRHVRNPVAPIRPVAARSLWARAGEIASGLLASLRRWDSRPGNAITHVDTVPEGPGPVRFLDSPPGPRVPDPEPLTAAPASARRVGPVPAAGDAARSASGAGAGAGGARRSSGPTGVPSGESAHLNPTLESDGAHWKEPAITGDGAGKAPWADPP